LKWNNTTEIMATPLQMSTLEFLLLEDKTWLRLLNKLILIVLLFKRFKSIILKHE
jgi:hypothetical protein